MYRKYVPESVLLVQRLPRAELKALVRQPCLISDNKSEIGKNTVRAYKSLREFFRIEEHKICGQCDRKDKCQFRNLESGVSPHLLSVHLVLHSVAAKEARNSTFGFEAGKFRAAKRELTDIDFSRAATVADSLSVSLQDLVQEEGKTFKLLENTALMERNTGVRVEKERFEKTVELLKKSKNRKQRKEIIAAFVSSPAWGDVKRPVKYENRPLPEFKDLLPEKTAKQTGKYANTFQISEKKLQHRVKEKVTKFTRKVNQQKENKKQLERTHFHVKNRLNFVENKSELSVDSANYLRAALSAEKQGKRESFEQAVKQNISSRQVNLEKVRKVRNPRFEVAEVQKLALEQPKRLELPSEKADLVFESIESQPNFTIEKQKNTKIELNKQKGQLKRIGKELNKKRHVYSAQNYYNNDFSHLAGEKDADVSRALKHTSIKKP